MAIGVLALVAIVDIVAVVADFSVISVSDRLLGGERISESELRAADDFQSATALAQTIALIIGAITFLLWFSRAYRNAIAMGIRSPRYGTRWAIGCWFVPIVNLIVPKRVANDVYRGSDPEMSYGDPNFHRRPVAPLLDWWWAIWLIDGFLARIAGRMYAEAQGLDALKDAALVLVFSDGLDAAASLVAILVIRKITSMSEERRERFAPILAEQAEGAQFHSPGSRVGEERRRDDLEVAEGQA